MKKERTLTTFECNHCKKRSEEIESGEGFPYEIGWIYIYCLDFKVAKNKINQIKDSHFCSKVCYLKEIEMRLLEALGRTLMFG